MSAHLRSTILCTFFLATNTTFTSVPTDWRKQRELSHQALQFIIQIQLFLTLRRDLQKWIVFDPYELQAQRQVQRRKAARKRQSESVNFDHIRD